MQSRLIEKDDGTKIKKMEVVADRISFLASSKSNNKNNVDNDSVSGFDGNNLDLNEADVIKIEESNSKSDKSSKKKK